MNDALDHTGLKAKQRAMRAGFPETMGLRVHRAISWIGRAEACGEDDDARFIFLWIAFNAAYADEREFQAMAPGERAAFVDYFGRLVTLDDAGQDVGEIGLGIETRELCRFDDCHGVGDDVAALIAAQLQINRHRCEQVLEAHVRRHLEDLSEIGTVWVVKRLGAAFRGRPDSVQEIGTQATYFLISKYGFDSGDGFLNDRRK